MVSQFSQTVYSTVHPLLTVCGGSFIYIKFLYSVEQSQAFYSFFFFFCGLLSVLVNNLLVFVILVLLCVLISARTNVPSSSFSKTELFVNVCFLFQF